MGDDSCDFKLLAYSGFAAADYNVVMSSGGSSDGGYITTARLDSRTLGIKFDFGGRNNAEDIRQSLISFFSPGKELTITANRGTIKRYITGRVSDFDISETNRYAYSVVDISILCPDPYFKASDTVCQSAATVYSMFRLPCRLPCVLGRISANGGTKIYNDGDTFVDMTAELVAYVDTPNPYIKNVTNGRKIQIKGNLNAGDVLEISTVRRKKGAKINGVRCLIDPSSSFSDFLEIGENNIVCSSENIAAEIRYTALYLGI